VYSRHTSGNYKCGFMMKFGTKVGGRNEQDFEGEERDSLRSLVARMICRRGYGVFDMEDVAMEIIDEYEEEAGRIIATEDELLDFQRGVEDALAAAVRNGLIRVSKRGQADVYTYIRAGDNAT